MSKISIEIRRIGNLDQSTINDIEHVLASSKNATIFHSLEWNRVVNKNGPEVRYHIAYENGDPVGVYPCYPVKNMKFFETVNAPLEKFNTYYGGPLAIPGKENILDILIASSEKSIRSLVNHVVTPPGTSLNEIFARRGYSISTRQSPVLNVGSLDELNNNMNRNTKRNIKKAEKARMEVSEAGADSIREYYKIYIGTMKNYDGFLPAEQFYFDLIKDLVPCGMMRFLIAEFEDVIVAGALFGRYKDTVYYSNAATNKELTLEFAPNFPLVNEELKWAADNGYIRMDFLGAGIQSITRFKMGWGSELKDYHVCTIKSPLFRVVRSILGKKGKKWQV